MVAGTRIGRRGLFGRGSDGGKVTQRNEPNGGV